MIETLHPKRLMVLLSAAVLCSCESSEVERPPIETIVTTVSGRAYDVRPLSASPVRVIDLMQAGSILFEGMTNEDGEFEVELGPLEGHVLIEVVGLQRIVTSLKIGEAREGLIVSPLTHLSSAYAMHLRASGRTYEAVHDEAVSVLGEHFGGIDISRVPIHNVFEEDAPELSFSVVQGILLAGLQGFEMADLYEDLSADGLFDGKGDSGAQIGGLHPDSLRLDYANSIASFLDSPNNATGFTSDDLRPLLLAIQNSESRLFPEGSLSGRDQTGPELSRLEFYKDGALLDLQRPISGAVEVVAEVSDESGLRALRGATETSTLTSLGSEAGFGRFALSSTLLSEGAHVLTIEAEDTLGNVSTFETAFITDNQAPVVSLQTPEPAPQGELLLSGMVMDASEIVRLIVSYASTERVFESPEDSFNLSLDIPCDTAVDIQVIAEDEAGNVSAPAHVIGRCLFGAPVLTLLDATHLQHGDLQVSLSSDGRAYSYAFAPSPREVEFSAAAIPTLEAFVHLLDETQGDFFPKVLFSATNGEGSLTVRYRCTRDGQPMRPFSELMPRADGLFELSVSYQNCTAGLGTGSSSTVFGLDFQLEDAQGQRAFYSYTFFLDLLAPPAFFGDCQEVTQLSRPVAPSFYQSPGLVPATSARFIHPMQAPALGAVTLELSVAAGAASSQLTKLGEEHIAPLVWNPPQLVGSGRNCGSINLGDSSHFLDFPRAMTSGCQPGAAALDAIFWDVQDGPVASPSVHNALLRLQQNGQVTPIANGISFVQPSSDVEVFVLLDQPRISLDGQPFAWSQSLDAIPAGYASQVATADRYRMPQSWWRSGEDYEGQPRSAQGLAQFRSRPFVTRPYVAELQLQVQPINLTATLGVNALAVPIQFAPSCLAPLTKVVDLR